MKYVVLVPDGMADLPLEELGDRTCMEMAHKPNMDMIARKGIVGTVKNIPRGMIPASDVANLSILGYDPAKYYCGRGPMEAANLGVVLSPTDVAFRFNTVTAEGDRMADYSAGHISSKEVAVITDMLNKEFFGGRYSFYTGTSYRNLLVVHCSSEEEAEALSKVKCFPPHDILDQSISGHMPKNEELAGIMEKSKQLLDGHEINKVRIDLNQNPANMIWLWGQGMKPSMPAFKDAYGLSGGMISAVDLLKGTGRILGLTVPDVAGATGYYDTNYDGKAEAALAILENNDFVFVHVEAPDEAGHNGDIRAKIKSIEDFDSKIVGKMINALMGKGDYRVLVLPDHPTPIKKRTHTSDPVPFAMAGKGITPDDVVIFSEAAAKAGSLHVDKGWKLMQLLIEGKK